MQLTPAEITALVARGGRKKPTARNYFYVRTPEGLQRFGGKPPADMVGSFQGKTGTVRRNKKGRTYKMPNGSRKYIIPFESQVVAYKVTP